MKICISTESTADLTKSIIEQHNIKVIPFTVILGETVALDGEITPRDIFDFVDEHGVLPRTSAINEFAYEEHFENLLKEYDAIVHISLSSALSSSYRNAVAASRKFNNVYVIDSLSLSTGVGVQVLFACKLRDEQKEVSEIVRLVEKRRANVQASFVVNTLNYLHKGGRCSGVSKIFGSLLRIKPQIIVNSDGKMNPGKKYMGRSSKCVISYAQDILETFNNVDKSTVFLTHSFATDEMIQNAKNVLKEHDIENVTETIAGATITSHCGPKCLGIIYYNDGGKY